MEKKKVDLKIEELEQRIAPGLLTVTPDVPFAASPLVPGSVPEGGATVSDAAAPANGSDVVTVVGGRMAGCEA